MVKILSDSTCDLSQDLISQYKIDILPLHILMGEQDRIDRQNVTPEEIFRWADQNATTPKTSAPSPEETREALERCLSQGNEVVCFTISASMSTTYQLLCMTAQDMGVQDRVFVVDSANLSTGIGLLVLEAAQMAADGHSAKEIVAHVEALKPKVRASFVVDTLTYLHRGGRCSGLAAMAGSVLKLHPRISVEDGAMHPGKKYRGKMSAVVLAYVRDMEEALRNARPERVFITHSTCSPEIVEAVRAYLQSLGVFSQILETTAGGVISSHCGPGTLGVLFIAS